MDNTLPADFKIQEMTVQTYTIPTDFPESDGTLAWDRTTLVLVRASAADKTGMGYTYADAATANLIYTARGVPYGPDDGTIAPWAAAASLPFAPEIVLPTMRHFDQLHLRENMPYGFKASFNPTCRVKGNANGWESPWHYGLNQGPVVLMIENYRTGFIWKLMQRNPYIVDGLRRAGFRPRNEAQMASLPVSNHRAC